MAMPVVEKTICVTDHERNVPIPRVLDYNTEWAE
jgi:hypothetical protein